MTLHPAHGQHSVFQQFAQSVGCRVKDSAKPSFDLLFEGGMPVTVSLHPNGLEVDLSVWCFDATQLRGASRLLMVKTLLRLNQATLGSGHLGICLDNRDFIFLSGRQNLSQLDSASFSTWLTWLADQGRRVRALVLALSGTHQASLS